MSRLLAGALALGVSWPVLAHAEVTFELVEMDDGLKDPTPQKPIGGNPGTTLGEQRRYVLERALSTWAKHLESEVPIEIEVSYEDLECANGVFPVAGTRIVNWISIPQPSGAAPLVYPSALANRLLGADQNVNSPDFTIQINSALDTPACRFARPYYGIEPPPSENNGPYMLSTLLHELAHGLGFYSAIDLRSGTSISPDGVDVFSAHVRDLDRDRTWAELTRAERATSALNVRRLVFDGAATNAATAQVLGAGTASLTFEPPIADFSGFIGDTDFGQNPALSPVKGPLATTYGADLCARAGGTPTNIALKPVLLVEDSFFPADTGCRLDELLQSAHATGAVGLVLPLALNRHTPVTSLDGVAAPVPLPIAVVSKSDAAALAGAASRGRVVASLGGHKDQLEGADPLGRPLLYATAPIANGSSISHFDTIARPNLLMEAYVSDASVDNLDLTVPVLRDLGWTVLCGNGRLDGKEACDEGEANDDEAADRCRTTCKRPSCGDGVTDTGEGCDNASQNSDSTPGACRLGCVPARCGDAVIDPGESCDLGAANGGMEKGACRRDCSIIGCGDGVLDPGEACDNGKANSDTTPNACRASCRSPACGDRVVDLGEECDGDSTCTSTCTRDAIATWRPIENGPLPKTEGVKGDGCSVTRARPFYARAPEGAPRRGLAALCLLATALCLRLRRSRRDRGGAGR